jgi:hypothetical protein
MFKYLMLLLSACKQCEALPMNHIVVHSSRDINGSLVTQGTIEQLLLPLQAIALHGAASYASGELADWMPGNCEASSCTYVSDGPLRVANMT